VVIITNAKCSAEKRAHITSNGATLWMAEDLPARFPDELRGEKDYMRQEELLAAARPEAYYSVNQYGCLDNLDAHEAATGREIFEQTAGAVTHFVMAASTGGTIMGVGRALKARKPGVEVVLADPEKSHLQGHLAARDDPAAGAALLAAVDGKIKATGGVAVEGAGKNALTPIMRAGGAPLGPVDYAVAVHDFDAFDECRATAATGLLVGGSAGLNICAAKAVAERAAAAGPRPGGVTIVTLLCDHGIKYLSKVFNDEWMAKHDTRDKK
jgi:cysteine synthase